MLEYSLLVFVKTKPSPWTQVGSMKWPFLPLNLPIDVQKRALNWFMGLKPVFLPKKGRQ